MINLNSALKSRDITLPTMVHTFKTMFFPVVMSGCESWTIKKAESQRTDALKWWCWRRLLRVPWTARRSNQSILQEINPEYSLERLMLKHQYFGHLMWGADSLEKTLMLGKTGQEEKEAIKDELVGWRHWLNGHESEQTQGGSDGQRSLQFVGLPRVGHNLATEQQQYYLLNHFLLSEQIKKLRGKEAITG